jgi:hypothetical protein
METRKSIDQNPDNAVSPEENTHAVDETAKQTEDGGIEEPEAEDKDKGPKEVEAEPVHDAGDIAPEGSVPGVIAENPEDTGEEKQEAVEEAAPEIAAPVESAVEATGPAAEEPAEAVKEEAASGNDEKANDDTDGRQDEVRDEEEDDDHDDDVDADEDDDVHEAFEEFSGEELVARLEELVQTEDITAIKTRVSLIKVAFLRILKEEKKAEIDAFLEEGGNKDDFAHAEGKLEKRFNKAFEVYRKNKIKYNEQQEKLKLVNLEKKNEILEKLKELINSEESLKKTYDDFRTLQAEWKEVGMVPSGEVSNLWQSYHFLVEKFFDKVKINKELRDLDMKKNLELKIELCEKTEELLLETSIIKSFKLLQKYHEEWKDIGPVPHEQNDEIWERFKAATDKINERRREHYGQLQEEQEKNLMAKNGLCEQAEELLSVSPDSMKGWQEQTKKMNELFSVWRSIGRAPKKENAEVWARFKGIMNAFFVNRKEFLNGIKQEQLNNYNMKVDLCVEAENLSDSTDWKKTTQELIHLQQEWKKIGPVPRKHADKIWKRFRTACDEFFNNKASHFSSVHDNEQQNLELKKDLIEKIRSYEFTEDKSKNLDILKNFQRQWMDIGFVPMKEKEKLQKEFREAIDARLDALKISSSELSNASYTTRMEAVKDSPDADRVYRKEINFLSNKISKMRDDIILWENNLGFFANSKKADILKKEFEQKLDKAKQEVAAMEAKMKYLRKMIKD